MKKKDKIKTEKLIFILGIGYSAVHFLFLFRLLIFIDLNLLSRV